VKRIGISRSEFGYALLGAAAPGAVALFALHLSDMLSASAAAGGLMLVLLAAAAVAFVWAREAAALRERTAMIAADDGGGRPAPALKTPPGIRLARLLEEARRRAFRVQRALEARALEAERLIDALPEPVLVVGQGRRLLHGNLAAEKLFGPALAGRNLAELLRNPDVLEHLEKVLEGAPGGGVDFQPGGGADRAMRAEIAALPPVNGGEPGAVLIFEDLTAVRRAQQMRVDFVANVSHELRTPLASLGGFIETLQGPAKDDARARERFLGIMADQARRMGRLVDDLLSLSRIEMEEHNPPSGWVEIGPAVASVVTLLQGMAAERQVTVEAGLPEGLPPVTGDADQVGQVLRNLIENAIMYGRNGGSVRITAQPEGPMLAVTVSDDGDGIPREHLHRLTERFYRMDAARSRRAGGTGLGLAIVKHIVNRHRGRLRIESTPGQGSHFTTVWPVAPAEAVRPDAPAVVTKASSNRNISDGREA